jgi:hypothetical protein
MIFATIGMFRAKEKGIQKLSSFASEKLIDWKSRISRRAAGGGFRWIDSAELSRLRDSDPELTVFHLMDYSAPHSSARPRCGEVFVSLPQLEEALPWIPRGSRFAIYRPEGINSALSKRLASITRGREVLLLAGDLPQTANGFDLIAGEPCD